MLFESLPTLDHQVIRLRPIADADIPRWAGYLNDPTVYEHTSWNHPTAHDLSKYLGNERSSEPDSQLRLAIALRDSNEFVGSAGFHTVSSSNRTLELTYDLDPRHWGKGFAAAAAACLVDWAHHQAQFIRVQATILESNARSRRTIESLGFRCEGLLRSYRIVRGHPGNFFMYAHVFERAVNS